MSEKGNDQMKTFNSIDSPNRMNAGQTLFNDVVWFIHCFNEFPTYSLCFTYVSMDLFEELFDNDDWELFFLNYMGIYDKKRYDEYYIDTDTDPFSMQGSKVHKSNSVTLVNDRIGLLYFKNFKEDKRVITSVNVFLRDTDEAKEFARSLHPYLNEQDDDGKPIINVVKKDVEGYKTRDFEVNHHELDFHKHYENSEKLEALHNRILDNVNDENKNQSFYIFHGDPGTGKTSYIKYLMTSIKKNVIYIPPHLIDMIADPHFVDFMADNSNSVIVIEDAEDLVQQDKKRSNALSNLLNMTDGILGDCFKMDFICTFNTDVRKIDEALMRNGRLNGIFKFTELGYDKAKVLCDEQGIEVPEEGERTLANIFGEEPEDVATEEDLVSSVPIGFNNPASVNGNSKKTPKLNKEIKEAPKDKNIDRNGKE